MRRVLIAAAIVFACPATAMAATPAGLTVEHQTQPLAVEAAAPLLGWHGAGDAYQVKVGTSPSTLGDVWDSGKVAVERVGQRPVRRPGAPERDPPVLDGPHVRRGDRASAYAPPGELRHRRQVDWHGDADLVHRARPRHRLRRRRRLHGHDRRRRHQVPRQRLQQLHVADPRRQLQRAAPARAGQRHLLAAQGRAAADDDRPEHEAPRAHQRRRLDHPHLHRRRARRHHGRHAQPERLDRLPPRQHRVRAVRQRQGHERPPASSTATTSPRRAPTSAAARSPAACSSSAPRATAPTASPTTGRSCARRFRVADKPIAWATAYVSARSTEPARQYVFKLSLNGKVVGVGPTRAINNATTTMYNAYDVTSLLEARRQRARRARLHDGRQEVHRPTRDRLRRRDARGRRLRHVLEGARG